MFSSPGWLLPFGCYFWSVPYWKLPFIVDLPIKNGGYPLRYVSLPDGKSLNHMSNGLWFPYRRDMTCTCDAQVQHAWLGAAGEPGALVVG